MQDVHVCRACTGPKLKAVARRLRLTATAAVSNHLDCSRAGLALVRLDHPEQGYWHWARAAPRDPAAALASRRQVIFMMIYAILAVELFSDFGEEGSYR